MGSISCETRLLPNGGNGTDRHVDGGILPIRKTTLGLGQCFTLFRLAQISVKKEDSDQPRRSLQHFCEDHGLQQMPPMNQDNDRHQQHSHGSTIAVSSDNERLWRTAKSIGGFCVTACDARSVLLDIVRSPVAHCFLSSKPPSEREPNDGMG